jgi:hypothetical protein
MKIKCTCGKEFEGKNHRAYDFSELPLEQQKWPFPGLSNILEEFTKYQIVKCPHCDTEYRDRSLKLFFFLSPIQLLGLIFILKV